MEVRVEVGLVKAEVSEEEKKGGGGGDDCHVEMVWRR